MEERCTMCSKGYYLYQNPTTLTYSCVAKKTTPLTLTLFVRPSPALTSAVNTAYLNANPDGLTIETAFPFIIQALNYAESQAAQYNSSQVTIYLTNGNHFFFWCDSETYTPNSADSTNLYYDYCT
jgi:hypothetical protein